MFNEPLFLRYLTDLKLDDGNLLTIAPRTPAAQQSGSWNKFLGRKKSPKALREQIRPSIVKPQPERDEAFILWRCCFSAVPAVQAET